MAWKQVSRSNAFDIKAKKGQPIVGTYTGSQEITTKIGAQTIYEFEDEAGEKFGIYGFTNLNRSMENVKVGELVRITYNGTERVQTKYGMKDVHQVTVEVSEDGAAGS